MIRVLFIVHSSPAYYHTVLFVFVIPTVPVPGTTTSLSLSTSSPSFPAQPTPPKKLPAARNYCDLSDTVESPFPHHRLGFPILFLLPSLITPPSGLVSSTRLERKPASLPTPIFATQHPLGLEFAELRCLQYTNSFIINPRWLAPRDVARGLLHSFPQSFPPSARQNVIEEAPSDQVDPFQPTRNTSAFSPILSVLRLAMIF